jgi:amino acid transporter
VQGPAVGQADVSLGGHARQPTVHVRVLVMASLAQVAGQYVFFLFNADGVGANPTSGWVLLVGVVWIAAMTYVAYRGIELSARFQKALLSIELVMLLVLSTVALVKVGQGHPGSITPSWSWFNPFDVPDFSAFASGIILIGGFQRVPGGAEHDRLHRCSPVCPESIGGPACNVSRPA